MYTNYFGLKENPFSISPDPRYLYMSERHREALAHLLYGVKGDGCFVLLTGDVGTGKTTVARCFLAQLPDNTDVAFIVNPRLTPLELLETICEEFKIPVTGNEKSVKIYIDRLNSYLLHAHAKGRNSVLLIDEAQNLSLDLLEQLRLLTNLETDQTKLLKIMLLGQTELKNMLEHHGAVQINQRITSRYHLLPLDRDNSTSYILHRLAVAGEKQKIFSRAALDHVFRLSSGIPRLINVLCDRAMLGAYVEEKYLVSGKIVDRAAQEVLGSNSQEKEQQIDNSRFWRVAFLSTVAIILCVSGMLYFTLPSEKVSLLRGFVNSVSRATLGSVPLDTDKVHEETVVKKTESMATEERDKINIIPLEIVE